MIEPGEGFEVAGFEDAARLGACVLVNVAGIDQFRRFEDLDVATWERHLGVNLAHEHRTRQLDWGLLTGTAGGRYGLMPPRDIADAVA